MRGRTRSVSGLQTFTSSSVLRLAAEVLVPPEPPVDARGNLKRTEKDGQGDERETEEEEARSFK